MEATKELAKIERKKLHESVLSEAEKVLNKIESEDNKDKVLKDLKNQYGIKY